MHHNLSRRGHPIVPCLCCHPQSYIRLVQHLIERCLMLHMSRDQCIKALEERAGIRPLVTLTVWRELLKENRDFFWAYFQAISHRPFAGRHFRNLRQTTKRRHG
ncbi:uncharacterized protein LOC116199950 [Punica granatum]|uniref:Uncharacterized protein LOC116199950 n=1 Tax=Punica granatum TaxID=22663 RepID=A0A6P8CWL1_PUNGR|nr:uncharacterized protein LOC116199950 [Punica granatum]